MNLYELSEQYKAVLNMVCEDADIQMIQDTLEGLEGDIESKVENTIKLMKSIEADETGIKAEEERLYNRRKALENRRESIKKYLEGNLINSGIEKVKTALFTASIQNNPPSINMVDETAFKECLIVCDLFDTLYVEQQPKLDRQALLKELKEGANFTGVELQQTKSIRIR